MDLPAALLHFSLVRGGPLFRLEQRLHLVPPWRHSQSQCVLAFVVLGWLPLLILALAQGGPAALRVFLGDMGVHTRMLVSLPVFVAAEPYIDGRLSLAARQFIDSALIDKQHLERFEEAARKAMRLRDSAIVEAGLLLVAFLNSFMSPLGQPQLAWGGSGDGGRLTLAGWWLLAVSRPLFGFLLLRWFWRSFIWASFLFRVSRLPLALVPTHPDATGGLRFLSTSQAPFSLIVFALASVLVVHERQVSPSIDLTRHAIQLSILALVALILRFVPLLPFYRQLLEAKRRGDHDFTALAAHHSRRFERRWFPPDATDTQEPLGAPEFSSLADLGTSFNVAQSMRWFPVSQRAVIAVICATAAPLLPVLIIDKQFLTVLLKLAGTLL